MSLGNVFETELLEHIFNNADITLVGDAGGLLGSVADGDLFVSLHTADVGEAGDQTTNEIVYTGYARVAVPRDGTGWTVTNNQVVNALETAFPQCTGGGPVTASHFAIGTSTSGAGKVIVYGTVSDPAGGLIINTNTTPKFAAGALSTDVD